MNRSKTSQEFTVKAEALERACEALDYANAPKQFPVVKAAALDLAGISKAVAADFEGAPRRTFLAPAGYIEAGMANTLTGPGYLVHQCGKAIKAARYAAAVLTAWEGVEGIEAHAAKLTNWADRLERFMSDPTYNAMKLCEHYTPYRRNFDVQDNTFKVKYNDTGKVLFDAAWDLRTVTAAGPVRDELDAVLKQVSNGVAAWFNDSGHLADLASRNLIALARKYAAFIEALYLDAEPVAE